HHLFPNVCHTYYKKINPIIEDTTQEFNIVYHNKTLSNMMISHLKHLKEMGKR
ncbi:MAG: acyl-CoA desaturase, partial [Bacteroidetes bacterium]